VLGYAMIETGVREGNMTLVDAGLRAIGYVVRHRGLQAKRPTSFESMAVAGAYNVARRHVAGRRLFTRHRRRWERWIRHVKPQWIGSARPYFNHTLVEAVSNLELLRTGLTSRVRGSVLNPRVRGRQARLTRIVVNRTIPRVAARTLSSSREIRSEVLSDRPDYPLAYHGLSLGLYARGVALLGKRAAPRTHRLLRRLSNASWLLTAPDGDLAYTGRSQEEVWALSATAYGAEYTANLPGTPRSEANRFQAVADRTVERVDDAHGIGPKGLWIVPALRIDPRRGLRGIDPYAGGAAFSGLALMELEWAIAAARPSRDPSELAGDAPAVARVLRGNDTTTLVRSGSLWYAVRQASSLDRHDSDLRWDFGLVSLKQLRDGGWRDVQPPRPASDGRATSAGPLLRLGGNGAAIPFGRRSAAGPSGGVTVSGGFRLPRPSLRWVRRGVKFRFRPVSCGVRMSFPARRGDRFDYSAFMRGSKRSVTVGRRSVADARHVVTFDAPAKVQLIRGYASGADPALVRARIRFKKQSRARAIAITVCAR
jgi:hypothetical protein